jgi:hypothetical protein
MPADLLQAFVCLVRRFQADGVKKDYGRGKKSLISRRKSRPLF